MNILITGASGFVGRVLGKMLVARGHCVTGTVRQRATPLPDGVQATIIPAIDGHTDWLDALTGIEAVVHLAARVHVMDDKAADPLAEFRKTNTAGTLHLARQAAARGVKRFVFVSSVKVNGESGHFTDQSIPAPEDAYGQSKWEAEQGLAAVAKETGLEIVILRPPLVYGPGVGANFFKLLTAVAKGFPLPFGLVENHRSLIFVNNLTDAITTTLTHPSAAGRTFLVSDGEDVSTPELIRRIAKAQGVKLCLLPVPPGLMRLAASLLGKRPQMDRLLGSLSIDSLPLQHDLGWTPPFTMSEGLQATADWYQQHKSP